MMDVDFSSFRTILEYSFMKVNINYDEVPLQVMMEESSNFKKTIQYLNKEKKSVQMLTNIVSFDNLYVMQSILAFNKRTDIVGFEKIDLSGFNMEDEKSLLTQAFKNDNIQMIACLLMLGLKAKNVWGAEWEFFEKRKVFIKEYGLNWANIHFGEAY